MSQNKSRPRSGRSYSQRTLKILFGTSTHCAFPDCDQPIIEPGTDASKEMVLAQICHIEASSDKGPRANRSRAQADRDDPRNLLLLCPNHHSRVDGQHETYPVELLREWKAAQTLQASQTRQQSAPAAGLSIIDREVESELWRIRRSRFFAGLDARAEALAFSSRLTKGDLSVSSASVRSDALEWCIRWLAYSEHSNEREALISEASKLPPVPSRIVARAFCQSADGDQSAALSTLEGVETPEARTAALQVVAHHQTSMLALDWFESSGLGPNDLDADGKLVLALYQSQAKLWGASLETLETASAADYKHQPALHYVAGMSHMLMAVPADLREVPTSQVPFEAKEFPLAADPTALEHRAIAVEHFREAAAAAYEFGARDSAIVSEQFGLWLELRHPHQAKREAANDVLKGKIRSTDSLHWVPIAVQFDLPIDPLLTEQEIERRTTLSGGSLSSEAALALLALAFTRADPKAAAEFIEKHQARLVQKLDQGAVASFQAQLLAAAGDRAAAESVLKDRVPADMADRLKGMLQPKPDARARMLEAEFERSDSTAALAQLVEFHERAGPLDKYIRFAQLLRDRTRSIEDAERLARAFMQAERWPELKELLASCSALIDGSLPLISSAAWLEFRMGNLNEARKLAAKLRDGRDISSDRLLFASIEIGAGQWESLLPFIEQEWVSRDARSTSELLWAGRLAQAVDSPRAKDFITHALRDSKEPEVLLAGYMAATKGGWEDDDAPANWLVQAADKSSDSGPVQKLSLSELINRQPDWEQHVADVWTNLRRGQIPLFVAAHGLRKTLIEMQLLPLLTNAEQRDVRRRAVIPLFSGKELQRGSPNAKSATFDITALFTLASLGLLERALDAFETIVLPHNILEWLFEERQKASFHQPSRVRNAHDLKSLIAARKIAPFRATTLANEDAVREFGFDLASMLADAQRHNDEQRQHLVVKPGPVHRLGSLLEEEADLEEFRDFIGGCLPVVDRLRANGGITAGEYQFAKAYLQMQETAWSSQPEVRPGAVLYLDDVAVAYFQHTRILPKLAAAGFTVLISPREEAEADALITFEAAEAKIEASIATMRRSLAARIANGRIKLAPDVSPLDSEPEQIDRHPTVSAFKLAGTVDVVVSDDRFMNQHKTMEANAGSSDIWTTLEVLDRLTGDSQLTRERSIETRSELRQAGVALLPLTLDELNELLRDAGTTSGQQNETAELRAIRENLLLILMKGWLNLPAEISWLDNFILTVALSLRSQWTPQSDAAVARARSEWLLPLLDAKRWSSAFVGSEGHGMARLGDVITLTRLTMVPTSIEHSKIGVAFKEFVEEAVVDPVEMRDPALLSALVEHLRRMILLNMARSDSNGAL